MLIRRKARRNSPRETCVIYKSLEDACWVAHGLRTDQIGMGDSIVEALADFMRAIDQVRKVAAQGRNVALYRPAPAEIRAKAKTARPLPREIYEIAHKKVYGKWPADLPVTVKPRSRQTFKAVVDEPLPA